MIPIIEDMLDGKKASYLAMYIKGLDFKKQDNYAVLMNDAIDKVVLFKEAIKPYLND